MTNAVVKQIPNILTTLRLILAAPICVLILNENYPAVLWIAVFAGLSDGVDGWLARKLNALSRYGAVVDPLADKALLVSAYISFAVVGLLPWWVAVVVAARDLVIVSGALAYHRLCGRYQMAPSILGKVSTGVQIAFALIVLTHQVYPIFPSLMFQIGPWLVALVALASGSHYVHTWATRALVAQKNSG